MDEWMDAWYHHNMLPIIIGMFIVTDTGSSEPIPFLKISNGLK